jgi:S-adenosylmethionine hydrolase
MSEKRVITLITDFGDKGGYVGAMKGVILTINPCCQIVDVTHGIAPQDVEEAAFLLYNVYSYFPADSIHLVVVDPGVGSERKSLLVKTKNYCFVGPDNGVLSFVLLRSEYKKVWEITNSCYLLPEVSATFHGRDVFAPVAAHLSRGVPAEEMGREGKDFVVLKDVEPEVSTGVIRAKVVYVDRFGNLVTNISRDLFTREVAERPFEVKVKREVIKKLSRSYAEAGEGEVVALLGSSGWLEIALKNGNCQKALSAGKGAIIEVYLS